MGDNGRGQGSGVTAGGHGTVHVGTAPREKPDTSTGQKRNERVAAKSTTKPKG